MLCSISTQLLYLWDKSPWNVALSQMWPEYRIGQNFPKFWTYSAHSDGICPSSPLLTLASPHETTRSKTWVPYLAELCNIVIESYSLATHDPRLETGKPKKSPCGICSYLGRKNQCILDEQRFRHLDVFFSVGIVTVGHRNSELGFRDRCWRSWVIGSWRNFAKKLLEIVIFKNIQ
jgi:hypothetical protein